MSYKFLENAILRTPAFPISTSHDEMAVKAIIKNKLFLESLFLSSPALYSEIAKTNYDGLLRNKSLFISVLKYIVRMKSRATPFGLLAQFSVVQWYNRNEVTLELPTVISRNTKLDTQYLELFKKHLERRVDLRTKLLYFPNNSYYIKGDKLRYVEFYYKNILRKYRISSVNHSNYLEIVLKNATNGETLNNLAMKLIHMGIEKKTSYSFIDNLVDAKVLVSELEPILTGGNQERQLLQVLNRLDSDYKSNDLEELINLLKEVISSLQHLDENATNSIDKYNSIIDLIKKLKTPFEINRLFQVDSNKELRAKHLSFTYKNDLYDAIKFLLKLPVVTKKSNLRNFKSRLYERYGDAEVPLLEVLDTETGIGYLENQQYSGDTNLLIDDIILPPFVNKNTDIKWGLWEDYLHQAVELCISNGDFKITLSEKNCSEVIDSSANSELPNTFGILFSVIDEKKTILYPLEGSSAGNMLGRFGSTSTEIENILNTITENEEAFDDDKILAEIIHLPQDRAGNILTRPQLREFEIPYLGKSTLPSEKQILVSDLTISIRHNRIYLRSVNNDREVLPRMTTAHNFWNNSLPIYHFLCDMQVQDKLSGVYFSWGALEGMYSFLPRVEYQNIILSPATWQLKKKAFEHLLKVKDDDLLKEIDIFRNKHNMPQRIAIADGDNELMIDLEDFWSVKMMLDTIKNRTVVKLIEFLFDPETAIVKDVEGNPYTNQFIATLIKEKPVVEVPIKKEVKNYKSKNVDIQRNFSLGSEWLYYKIYCGYKTADRVLTELIKPLTENLLEQELISNWFFIRYADPDPHLRLRFRLTDKKHIGIVIEKFSKQIAQFENWDLVWKTQTDTYKRELERYGKNSMELAEQLFYYDSVATVNMVDLIEGDAGEEIRWKYCIRAIDELLSEFGYTSESKRDLLDNLKTGFAQEFNMNRDLKKQIDKKFRDSRTAIEEVLDRGNDATSEILPLFKLLQQKGAQEAPIIKNILKMEKTNELMLPLDSLLSSFIHMLVNRLFKSKQRVHELVIYDFMYRHYRSSLAKQKNLQKENVLVNGGVS